MERLFENLGSLKWLSRELQRPLERANLLLLVGLWPKTIKTNPSCKTEVRKSAWINPCKVAFFTLNPSHGPVILRDGEFVGETNSSYSTAKLKQP